MIYLVYGEEEYLIDSFINDEIKKKKLEVINKYEYPKTSILEVIDDSMYLDLFGGSKGIIYKNCTFLNTKDDNISELVKYINNPNPEVCLFITLNESKIDERREIVKVLMEKATVKCFGRVREQDINKFVISYLKENGLKIESRLASLVTERVGSDFYIVKNELDKLILYKDDDVVTKEDIEKATSVSLENDVFKLVNAITERNIKKIMSYYNDLIRMGNHPSAILTLIANQFRLIYQVKILSRSALSESNIASEIGVHPYQVKLASGKCTLFSEKELIDILYKLALIDEDLKLSRIETESALEGFFIELCK